MSINEKIPWEKSANIFISGVISYGFISKNINPHGVQGIKKKPIKTEKRKKFKTYFVSSIKLINPIFTNYKEISYFDCALLNY